MSYVVVSGLPGSGKSTVARGLAARSGLPLLDKDAILEALFDSLGVGDGGCRGRLSRAADEVLYRVAADARQGVLDNGGTTTPRRPACGRCPGRWSRCSAPATRTSPPPGSAPGAGTRATWTS